MSQGDDERSFPSSNTNVNEAGGGDAKEHRPEEGGGRKNDSSISPGGGLGEKPKPPRSQRTPQPPPRRIDHTYRDYSNYPASEVAPGRKSQRFDFPSKLHKILSTGEFAHIISWMPHGRSWKIHDKALLVQEVISRYFTQTKYESFTRQLNGWGFKRLHQSGNDYGSYYHECFLRGRGDLTALMKRVPSKQGKRIPFAEGEPNFYEIDGRFPLAARGEQYHNAAASAVRYETQAAPPAPPGHPSLYGYSPYPKMPYQGHHPYPPQYVPSYGAYYNYNAPSEQPPAEY